jgi:phage terminase small subunit
MGLTGKRKAFIDYYFICGWNATEAARRAGYSKKTANRIGPELLHMPAVAEAIQARIDERAMSADEVLTRLAEQARGSMADFLSVGLEIKNGQVDDGAIIDLSKANDLDKLHLIKKLSKTKEGWQIELYDAQAALVQLGRHHAIFIDRNEISGPNGGPIPVEDARAAVLAKLAGIDSETGSGETSGAATEPAG